MYAVVGCPSCGTLWIRETGGEQTTCPACRRTHDADRLQPLFESEEIDDARDARTALLAERNDENEVASFGDLAEAAADPVVEPAEQLAAAGIDPTELEGIADTDPTSRNRQQIVRDAIAAAEPATADEIVEAAAADGVPPAAARDLLEKLRTSGQVTTTDGRYRLV